MEDTLENLKFSECSCAVLCSRDLGVLTFVLIFSVYVDLWNVHSLPTLPDCASLPDTNDAHLGLVLDKK